MTDLVLKERDGWFEITYFVEHELLQYPKFWEAMGRKDLEKASSLLRDALDEAFEQRMGFLPDPDFVFPDIRVVTWPNEVHGEIYRIWVYLPRRQDWRPGRRRRT